MNEQNFSIPHLVVVGGGFAGLTAITQLKNTPVRITLIDRRNHHLFQPLLYQVATGGLSPANIAAPLRYILRRQRNTSVLMAEVKDFDLQNRRVLLDEETIDYDYLVVAAGASEHQFFGHPEWEEFSPGLKSIDNATRMRRKILQAFEEAERATDPEEVRKWMTFIIVGAGPTGVELAGALAELAKHSLVGDFRSINPAEAKIYLLDAAPRVLPAYPENLSKKATTDLEKLGITVMAGKMVSDVKNDRVCFQTDSDQDELEAYTILWGAGVQPSPLGKKVTDSASCDLDKQGRVVVEADLTVAGHPECFVAGDLAAVTDEEGNPLPGTAAVAIQQGKHVGKAIQKKVSGQKIEPFQYKRLGEIATIGRASAVADLPWTQMSGYPAWMAWLVVHLVKLVAFENRILVLIQWAWHYLTWNKSARLILGKEKHQAPKNSPPKGETDSQ